MKFADGKTLSANVPHLNVWGFDISAAEFPQPKKTRVFGVNRPSATVSSCRIIIRILLIKIHVPSL